MTPSANQWIVPLDPPRLPNQQGRQATDLYPHGKGCFDRSQPNRPNPTYLQAICGSYGPTSPPPLYSLRQLTRETPQSHRKPHHRPPSSKLSQGYPKFRVGNCPCTRIRGGPRREREYLCLCWSHGQRFGQFCG